VTDADVEILHVDLAKDGPDIFEITRDIRNNVLPNNRRGVSPNHILIPANEDHSCPYGPPVPADEAGELAGSGAQHRRVTIIDSGYQWDAAWGANPLGNGIALRRAEWLRDHAGWKQSKPDRPHAHGAERLDALAGHANFIAGVIAQATPYAKVEIRNHNGAFLPTGDDLPTEASVIRSLCRCRGKADVINVGFAFTAFDNTASCAWDIAFKVIGEGAQGPVVVAPAGNQASSTPRYPAALHYTYPDRYRNVIGVGSTGDARDPGIPLEYRKAFSNLGEWVTCSANGANVHSTFLKVNMKVEDGDDQELDFASSWAWWNGTSFATPRVVAEIVNVMIEQDLPAPKAWEWLRDNESVDVSKTLGYEFAF
jgi:hypothetical protein